MNYPAQKGLDIPFDKHFGHEPFGLELRSLTPRSLRLEEVERLSAEWLRGEGFD